MTMNEEIARSIQQSTQKQKPRGIGDFLLEMVGSAYNPVYKDRLIRQNEMDATDQLRRQGKAYSDKLWGQEAHTKPFDALTQELVQEDMQSSGPVQPYDMPMNEVTGTGLMGNKMTIQDYLQKQQSNPNKAIGMAANSMLADRLKQKTRGAVNFNDYDQYGEAKKLRYDDFMKNKRAPLVNIDNTGQRGRWATDEESALLGAGPGKRIWIDPKSGPRVLSTETEKQVASGVVADSVLERLSLLDEQVGENYAPEIKDNLNQFGLPDSVNNLFRTDKGKAYLNTHNSIVADIVKDITGAASTDPEFKRLYAQMAYVTGDELSDMQYKRKLLDMRVDDMYAKSGRSRAVDSTQKAISDMTIEEIEAELAGE